MIDGGKLSCGCRLPPKALGFSFYLPLTLIKLKSVPALFGLSVRAVLGAIGVVDYLNIMFDN
jgi:hypothetical protein